MPWRCAHCRTGWQQLCRNVKPMVRVYGNNDDGGHAPHLRVPANTVVALPEDLSFEAGTAIACGTGTAYQALRRMHVSAADTIANFGQGPVGLSATQFARAMRASSPSTRTSSGSHRRAAWAPTWPWPRPTTMSRRPSWN